MRRDAVVSLPPVSPVPAIGYIRVSTAEQASSGLGLEAQRAAITDACRVRHLELLDVLTDAGVSSVAADRPGLTAALTAVEACQPTQTTLARQTRARGKAQDGRQQAAAPPDTSPVLVVAKLDRLARSLSTYAQLLDRARRNGWHLLALDAPDATTPHGEAMQAMTAVFAQLERRLISQRTKEALAAARARGVQLGRPSLVDDATAAEILRLRRRRRLSGEGIARELNARGVPGPTGGAWSRVAVGRILAAHGVKLARGRPPSCRPTGQSPRKRRRLPAVDEVITSAR